MSEKVDAPERLLPHQIRQKLNELARDGGYSSRSALLDSVKEGELDGTILETEVEMLLHLLGKRAHE